MLKTIPIAAAALGLLAGPALAQAPAQGAVQAEPKTFASAADIQALVANARKTQKPGAPNMVQAILTLAPYRANLEHRTGDAAAAVHEKEAELFVVLDGSGTLVTGGKLTQEKRTNPTNLSGAGIEGGQSRTVAKGDMFIVPENTPHQFIGIKGELILMSLHVPRG